MPDNRLAGQTSPYLLQHADNPVAWRPWGPEALAEAKALDRPILLSIGYAACHWCHVMAHESFEDEEVAEVMNELFVNIKVDREERPDIDQIYMSALHAMGEQGGWPLTMFLTPEAVPFWGGTYFPKTARYGRPGFVSVLQAVAEAYRRRDEAVSSNARALLAHLSAEAEADAPVAVAELDQATASIARIMDPVRGGTKGAPKFPNAGLFEMIWRGHWRSGDPILKDLVLTTLTNICQGGIYDHLGGGFARYSVDDRWLVPHFEKMLYDNALLIPLLVQAHGATGRTLFRARVEETVDWLAREMTTPGGAFAASLDADSEGEEGRFYVWTLEEIRDALGAEDAALFAEHYRVTADGNFEGKNVLNRLGENDVGSPEAEARLTDIRERLLARRAGRVRPGLDDKVLADWNGLAIRALAVAGSAFGRPDWIRMAAQAYGFVVETMERDGALGHSWRAGSLLFPGLATDHAMMIEAAVALHGTTGRTSYLVDATRWFDTLEARYRAPAGGYYWTSDQAEALLVRPSTPADEAVPNANGVMVDALARLHAITGEARFRDRADEILAAHAGAIRQNVFQSASLLNGFDQLLFGTEVVVIGEAGERTDTLVEAAFATPAAGIVVSRRTPGDPPPEGHPAHGKEAVGGAPTAYVCRQGTCSLPVTTPADLAAALSA